MREDELLRAIDELLEGYGYHSCPSFKDLPCGADDLTFEALREVVLNMVMHRDYGSPAINKASVFDDRIEFMTAGGLARGVRMDEVTTARPSVATPRLANVMFRLGMVEAYGIGIAARLCGICWKVSEAHRRGLCPRVQADAPQSQLRSRARSADMGGGGVSRPHGWSPQNHGTSAGASRNAPRGLNSHGDEHRGIQREHHARGGRAGPGRLKIQRR